MILVMGLIWSVYAQEPSDSIVDDTIIIEDATSIEVEEKVLEEPRDTLEVEYEYPTYSPWDVATLQGKLKMKGLPMSPSLKIYLEKDSLIDISVRAPFVGEAVRLIFTPDSIFGVNKLNKTYIKERIGDWLPNGTGNEPGYKDGGFSIGGKILGLGEIQDLLLGRFFLPGIDVSEVDLDDYVEVFYEDEQLNVIPKGEAEIPGVKYGFVVDNVFTPLLLVVVPTGREDIEVSAEYKYKLQGYVLLISYLAGNQGLSMTLELKEPEWKGERPKSPELSGKYKKVNLIDFVKDRA